MIFAIGAIAGGMTVGLIFGASALERENEAYRRGFDDGRKAEWQ